jgi:hypothetical protein
MATIEKLNRIAQLTWESDVENADGFVAEVGAEKEADLERQFRAAGFAVSTSKDTEGKRFLWVA